MFSHLDSIGNTNSIPQLNNKRECMQLMPCFLNSSLIQNNKYNGVRSGEKKLSVYQVLNKLNVNSEEGKTWAWQFQIYGLLSSKVGTKMSEEARQSLSGTGWLVSYSKGTAAPQLQSILVIYHQLFLFFEGRQIFGFFSCNCPIFKCEC